MILNTFNVINEIRKSVGEFDDSIYIIDSSINQVKLSINSIFDWESLTNELEKGFPQANFSFLVIGLDLIINW
ncbi:MAG: hypothetical protein IKR04_02380 [Clostridia bacterium]|nr:hypothetical protein [Clostridia bacterium]